MEKLAILDQFKPINTPTIETTVITPQKQVDEISTTDKEEKENNKKTITTLEDMDSESPSIIAMDQMICGDAG